MPTILFLMKYPIHRNDNLKGKFDGQMAAARALDWQAYCIGWDEKGMSLIGDGVNERLKTNALAAVRGYEHTKIFSDLMTAAREVMKRMRVDVMYLRYMPTFSGAVKTVKMLKEQGGRLVIEHPTYPIKNQTYRRFLRRQIFRYTDGVLAKINPMVDLYTLIGTPCGGELDGRPAMNIVNGIDVDAFTLHEPNPDAPVRLLALASMSRWHGYDRILRSLAAYKGSADVRLEMVGGDGDGSLAQWRALAEELGLMSRVTFHGAQYGEALERIIAECDVGVGVLGMHRAGVKQATALKIREYTARGLPFINAVYDPAFADDPPFELRVPDDDSPISMEEIVTFAEKVKHDKDLPVQMRTRAEAGLSWRDVIKGVFEKLGV